MNDPVKRITWSLHIMSHLSDIIFQAYNDLNEEGKLKDGGDSLLHMWSMTNEASEYKDEFPLDEEIEVEELMRYIKALMNGENVIRRIQ